MKFALAALLILIGSHLFLWSWLKRKVATIQRDMERDRERERGAHDRGPEAPVSDRPISDHDDAAR